MCRSLCLLVAVLLVFLPDKVRGSALVLSEFMAKNEVGLKDENGDASDWIEIYNPGTNTVSLLNWSLTDSKSRLDKWVFPNTNLVGGGLMVVFASEKDRRLPGAPLHTNFKLSDTGEYLALVEPNRTTIATEYAPKFPTQFKGVSYGLGMEVTSVPLITNGSPVRLLVPVSGTALLDWTEPGFEDASWPKGTQPVGFDVSQDPAEDTYVGAVSASAPLIYYRFSETNGLGVTNVGTLGSVANAIRVGAVGTNQVGPQAATFGGFETNNRAYRFGTSARVRVPDVAELNVGTGAFAFSLWFTPSAPDTASDLLTYRGNGGQFSLQISSPGVSTLSVFHNGLLGTVGGLVAGTWYHCVVTRDAAGQLDLYLNGVLAFSALDTQSMDIDNDLLLGAGHNGDPSVSVRPFNGRMDEFAYWNRGLTESEITEAYLIGKLKPTSFGGVLRQDISGTMLTRSTSLYVRIPFVVQSPDEVDRLLLRAQYDDGLVAYLNGQEVLSLNAPESPTWDSAATARHPDREAVTLQEFNITDLRSALRVGTNILALHGLNLAAGNPDFLMGVELEAVLVGKLGTSPRYFLQASPGLPNGAGTKDLGPIISSLEHAPSWPRDAEEVLITARVEPSFSALGTVQVKYRVNYGVTNVTPMFDDGLHGDGAAGDGLFGVILPSNVSTNSQCVRYKVEATDILGKTSRWPLFEDPLGSPEYQGWMVQDPLETSTLPIWRWWAKSPSQALTRTGERVSVYFNGEFYDNVFARDRGAGTTHGAQKFDFNRGFRCKISDEVGRVEEANLNTEGSDPTFIRPPLAFDTYRRAGNPACKVFPVQLRLNGKADRLANYVEQVDTLFVRRFGYNDQGVLYKFVQRGQITPVFSDSTDGVEKKTFLNEPNTDLQQIVDALKLPTAAQRQAFFFDKFNIPVFVNFLACRSLVQDADDVRKNFYLYYDRQETGEWVIFPWDKDWTFGVTGDGGDSLPHPFFGEPAYSKPDSQANVLWQYFFTDPLPREMYLRRLRSVIDQQLQPPWTPAEFLTFETRVDEWLSRIVKDQPSAAGGVQDIKNFFAQRRKDLYVTYSLLGTTNVQRSLVPDAQRSRVPIQFGTVEVNPASGNQSEEFIQLINTNDVAVDISGWQVSGGIDHVFQSGTVIPASKSLYLSPNVMAFRARKAEPHGGMGLIVQGNYHGQLSARGEDLVLVDHVGRFVASTVAAPNPSLAQQSLRISEVMFHPEPPAPGSLYAQEAYQFIELLNYGSAPVDLAGIAFVDGVQFVFPRETPFVLAPQGRVVLVQNADAFVSRYGKSIPIAGVFTGRIDFGGEKLRLEDARGEEIQEVTIDSGWQLLADGEGFALVAREEEPGTWDQWGKPGYWRASSTLHGSPGAADPFRTITPVVVDEIVNRGGLPGSDAIELRNLGNAIVDISGWYVSDDPHTPQKYRIPAGSKVAAGGSFILRESEFAGPSALIPFTLRSSGDEAFIYSADAAGLLTGYAHGLRFGATELGGSVRRWVTTDGAEWAVATAAASLGQPSKGEPTVQTAVLGEIHYHPVDLNGGLDNTQDEFIEIRNLTSQRLPLFELTQLQSTWAIRGDVDFDFPTNVFLPPQGAVVLVHFDPVLEPQATAQFWAHAGVAPSARLFGPYQGKLSNGGGRLRLVRRTVISDANDVEVGTQIEVTVDEVAFEQGGAWPSLADGQGASLHRRVLNGFGSEPGHWMAAAPTPGRQSLTGESPVVTVQPQDRQGILGSPLTLSVAAIGTAPLRYQWEFEGQAILSATNAVLLLSNPVPDQAGRYRALVMNGFGTDYSASATVDFTTPPIVVTQPTNQVALLGGKVSFRVAAIGKGTLRYQWRRNGSDISGATSTNLALGPIVESDFASYSVVVSDQNGSIQTAPATLTLSTAPVLRSAPQDISAVLGESIVFSVVVDAPPPLTYRWRRGTTALSTVTLNDTVAFLSITNVKATDAATNYSVVVTNLAGTLSNVFSLTLLADVDKDGMADSWELQHGFNPGDASDALLDSDQDGRSNRDEYLAGTDPKDPSDVLRLEFTGSQAGVPEFRFGMQPTKTYGIEMRSELGLGKWQKLIDIPAIGVNQPYRFGGTNAGQGAQFYRVITPRQP